MELEARLRAFTAFARRRSFSGAAAELRISQPAVSKHVADLERVLGLKLAFPPRQLNARCWWTPLSHSSAAARAADSGAAPLGIAR
jgi:hypothetical protein